jgi:hypothetical protein
MNIIKRLAEIKAAHISRTSTKNYDHCKPHAQSSHTENVTIGYLKSERLRIKNMRRAENGLPPKATYAEI